MELNGQIQNGGSLVGSFGYETGDYNLLSNKPQINGVELVGNKTSEDLHITGGGTDDYNDLDNKPMINGVQLSGNLSPEDLGLAEINFPDDPTLYLNGSGEFTEPDYFSGDYDDLSHRPQINGVTLTGNLDTGDLLIDYDDISGRPSINSQILTGNKTSADLGLEPAIDYPHDATQFYNGNGEFAVPDYFSGDYEDLDNKPQINGVTLTGDKLTGDLNIDYNDISSHPEINSIELTGDKTGNDLKLTSADPFSGSGASIHFEADDQYNLLSCEVDFEPDQDLHGYSKPWTGGAGTNKWDEQWENGTLDTTTGADINTGGALNQIRAKNKIPVVPNSSYYIKTPLTPSNQGLWCIFYESDGITVLTGATITNAKDTDGNSFLLNNDIYIIPANAYYMRFYVTNGYGNTYNNNIAINNPSTNTEYSPYANICPISGHSTVTINISPTADPSEGQDITIQLGDTYYKGNINITTGKIALTQRMISENDFIAISGGTSAGGLHYVNTNASDPPATTANAISDRLAQNQGGWNSTTPCLTTNTGTAPLIYPVRVYCEEATLTDFKTNYSGLQILYELQTPIETAINPQAIRALDGDNYITAGGADLTIEAATQIFDPIIKWLVNNR